MNTASVLPEIPLWCPFQTVDPSSPQIPLLHAIIKNFLNILFTFDLFADGSSHFIGLDTQMSPFRRYPRVLHCTARVTTFVAVPGLTSSPQDEQSNHTSRAVFGSCFAGDHMANQLFDKLIRTEVVASLFNGKQRCGNIHSSSSIYVK